MKQPEAQKESLDAVRRMQDFIEAHIQEPINLRMLATVAGYSPWYAARIFREHTGRKPFDYIRSLRLSRAAERLNNGRERIVDVALDFVFESHEGFTRAFSREFGITPRNYARYRPAIRLFMPVPVQGNTEKMEGEREMTKTVFVQVIDRPARKLIYKPGTKAEDYYAYCGELGCDVWDELVKIKDALYEPVGLWIPENLRPAGTSVYWMGVEMPADYRGPVPDGYSIMDLPPCKMMIFQGEPYDDEKFEEAITDLWDVMKKYNPELYGFRWADEDGPRFQLSPEGYRGYIEGKPVRQINAGK